IPKIFNMFYRGHDKATGSGLGLYIVKQTLHKMQGKIQVESEEGKGTTFILEIPNLRMLG
ncbi:MAG: sensor histidine kinase, partial [Bacteroidia bacterium]